VLPSPPIGIPHAQPVDPPWYSKSKSKVEEAAIDQKELVRFLPYMLNNFLILFMTLLEYRKRWLQRTNRARTTNKK
jgi:hypothetical protein